VVFRRRVQAVVLGILLMLATVFGAAPAFGYWSATGAGSTTVTVGTLGPPTKVYASSALVSDSVPVSWTASASQLAPAGYYVTRITAKTPPMPACGSGPAALVTRTSCSDAAPAGEHAYVVTAVYRSWTAASSPSATVNVLLSVNNTLAFTSQPGNVTAGTLPAVRVQLQTMGLGLIPVAQRTKDVLVTVALGDYPAGGSLTGASAAFSAYTDQDGVATFTNLSITKAGAGYSLVVSSSAYAGAVSDRFAVTAGPASQLVVTSAPSLDGLASATANIAPITVERRDLYGNPTSAGLPALSVQTNSVSAGFFAAAVGGSGPFSMTIPAGSASTTFYYGNTRMGSASLQFGAPGLSAPPVVSVRVSAGAPSKVVFDAMATDILRKTEFNATVRVLDSFDNPTSGTVTLQSTDQPGCKIGVNASATALLGIASFALPPITANQTGCQLKAASNGQTALSTIFHIV
jgi:hypothetical protein